VLRFFINYRPPIEWNRRNWSSQTPLCSAAIELRYESIEFLVMNGVPWYDHYPSPLLRHI
jgi:hypothetical protein